MDLLSESRGARRIRNLARFAVFWALIIVVRLIYLQVYQHTEHRQAAERQAHNTVAVPAPRGRILDRTGQVLALSVPADTIVVNPRIVSDLSLARDIFVPILGLDAERLQARIDWSVANNRGYLPIKQKVSPEESEKIRSLKLDWVEFHRDSRRRYPKGSLAANVIGTVNFRGSGNSGLEFSLNEELSGRPGRARILRDARGAAINTEILNEPEPGADIGLTIDERIQYAADRALKEAAVEWGCTSGSVVVMQPRTGEILAMSSYPSFDPNVRAKTATELKARTNQAISVPFEPGSVFKVFTLAAVLESTDLTPSTLIDCGRGVLALPGRRVRDIKAYGTLPLEAVLWKSSNIGTIKAVYEAGDEELYRRLKAFGFGEHTGVCLPHESRGRLADYRKWQKTSMASIAMGHEVSATTLQLARAISVVANGGLLKKPRLIRWIRTEGEQRQDQDFEPAARVVSAETAHTMRMMMEGVVLQGTGQRARLAGFTSGGKTGSAQIWDPETRRYSHEYNASFTGFAPVTEPQIVVAVTLNHAQRYGGVVAAPVFQKMAQTALRILGTVPDLPDFSAFPEVDEEDYNDLAIAGLGAPPEPAEGDYADAPTADDGDEEALLAQASSLYVFGPTVPDFHGQTLRSVLEETSRRGLPVEYVGAGIVRSQYPPPGAVLPVGEKVLVEFAR